MATSRLAVITFVDGGPVDPGFGVGGGYPSHGLPGGGYPSHGLPNAPVYPSQGLPPGSISTLPVFPFDPTVPSNELPEGGGEVDNSLPRPGKKYVVKWLACHGLILVPDNTLPETAQPK